VIAHVDDHSASGAIIALQGASLRRMNSDAIIMIHPPISTVVGTAEQLESEAARTRILQEKIIALYTERTGQPESTVRQWHSRNNYFSASQALEAGLIDEIVPAAKGIVPAEAVVDALNEQAFNSLVPAAGVDSLPFSAPGALRIEIPAEIPALNL
jgi:hypothetical protein